MNLKEMINAIEENNRMNEGAWDDWEDCPLSPEHFYGEFVGAYANVEREFLNSLIRLNGDKVAVECYLNAMHLLEYGVL